MKLVLTAVMLLGVCGSAMATDMAKLMEDAKVSQPVLAVEKTMACDAKSEEGRTYPDLNISARVTTEPDGQVALRDIVIKSGDKTLSIKEKVLYRSQGTNMLVYNISLDAAQPAQQTLLRYILGRSTAGYSYDIYLPVDPRKVKGKFKTTMWLKRPWDMKAVCEIK